jgi:hypothetical protein
MIPQEPAKGILLVNDWGASKVYKTVCQCGDDSCTHTIDIDAEDVGVTITVYTQTRTNFWSTTRWAHIWTLLTKGYIETESCIIMTKQVALNYANVLQLAIKDVEEFRKKDVKD